MGPRSDAFKLPASVQFSFWALQSVLILLGPKPAARNTSKGFVIPLSRSASGQFPFLRKRS